MEYELEEATKIRANTLEELAEKMNVDKKQFLETIEAYNTSVLDGEYNKY